MTVTAQEVVKTDKSRIACDGGGEHPRVWLQIARDPGHVDCPYCECRFVLQADAGH